MSLRMAEESGSVVISVTDTGPGISEDDLSKLFQPFTQVSGAVWGTAHDVSIFSSLQVPASLFLHTADPCSR